MSYDFPDQQKNEKKKDVARDFRVDEEKNKKLRKNSQTSVYHIANNLYFF